MNPKHKILYTSPPLGKEAEKEIIMSAKNMTYTYKLVNSDQSTGHLGAKCALVVKKARLGVDYGLVNLAKYTARIGKEVSPEDIFLVKLFYEDGYFRYLGCKAKVQEGDIITLYGNNSIWVFRRW